MDLKLLAFFTLLSGLSVLAWFTLFKAFQPKSKRYIATTFIAGMISVLPIKLYEKYWSTTIAHLEHINLFTYLSEVVHIQSFNTLLAYTTATIFVLMALFIFTGILMAVLEIGSGEDSWKTFRHKWFKILECPAFFITIGILCGLLGYFSSLGLSKVMWFFIMVGLLEEFIKNLVLRFADEDKIQSVREAVQYAIVVALGFAFVENILYAFKINETGLMSFSQLAMVIALRCVISVGAHVGFSGLLGYFYGQAKFAKPLCLVKPPFWREKMHQILHVRTQVLFHDQKMLEGVILAMGLHALFNIFLEIGKPYLAIIEVALILYLLNYIAQQKKWSFAFERLAPDLKLTDNKVSVKPSY